MSEFPRRENESTSAPSLIISATQTILETETHRAQPVPPADPESVDEGRRKRARMVFDSITEEAVFHLQYPARPLQHLHRDRMINKTCFFVGMYKLLNQTASKAIWVTALHHGLENGMVANIKRPSTHGTVGDVIYTNEMSHIAIVASDSIPQCEPLIMQSSRRALGKVVIAGYMHAVCDTPCLLGCHIAKVEAPSNVTQLHSEFGVDAFAKWRTGRFFLLDQTTDFGFAGSPVVNGGADVVEMLCGSENVTFSWALKSDFITEALCESVHLA